MPTPVPITPPTQLEILNTGVSIVQTFGLIPFLLFATFASTGIYLYQRIKRASR